jgi:hypothetical protein
MGPEEKKFTEWFNKQKSEGLVDLKVTMDPCAKVTDREALCAELNSINDAIESGKCTPIDWKEIENE